MNGLFLRFSRTLGMAKGKHSGRTLQRWDPERKPTLGGITLYIIFLFCSSFPYGPFFEGNGAGEYRMLGLLGAATLAFLMGLSDDVYETRPYLKLAVQASCGAILVLSGTAIALPGPDWVSYAFTILWVILLMNSFNMIDNMDGIAGGIALTIIGSCLIYSFWYQGGTSMAFSPLLIGMLAGVLGFLFFNVHPSSMFLGDAGTQFLGLFLAFIGVHLFWGGSGSDAGLGLWQLMVKAMGLLLAFWATLADTITVFTLRLMRGVSPLRGGKDHTTHALSYAGFSDRSVNLLFFLWSALNASLAFYVMVSDELSTLVVTALVLYILITFALLFANAYRKEEKLCSA